MMMVMMHIHCIIIRTDRGCSVVGGGVVGGRGGGGVRKEIGGWEEGLGRNGEMCDVV